MKLTPLFPEKLWKASIHWSKPKDYELVKNKRTTLDGKAHFYKISGKKEGVRKLLYIGKTYTSEVYLRLKNFDHQKRYKAFLKKGFSDLQVSHGILSLRLWNKRYPHSQRIDDIETLLIFSNHVEDSGVNARKHKAHGIADNYKITNSGCYKPLKRQVFLTIFASN